MRQSLRALPRPAWILYAGTFINRFGSFVAVFLILYLTKNGYSATEAGLAVGAYGVGGLPASGIGGYLADRIGRKTTIAISMFGSAVAMMALSQARGYGLILATVALAGLMSELYRPASSALLADLVPEEQRVVAFAAYRLAINAGFAFGPALAGFLANSSFFYLFVGDAVTSAAFGTIALLFLPHGVRRRDQPEAPVGGVAAVLRDRSFMVFCLATLIISFVYFQGETTLALHVRANGLSPATYGTLLSFNGLIIVFLELAFSGITQRKKARPVMALGAVLTGAGFTLTAAAHSFPALAGTVFVWTLGEIVHAPVAQAYVANLAPAHMRGRYLGIWGFSFGLAFILAPTVGAWLFGLSPTILWLTCGGLSLVAAALILKGPEREVTPVLGPEPGPEIAGVET